MKYQIDLKIHRAMPYKNDDGTIRNRDADIVHVIFATDLTLKEAKRALVKATDSLKLSDSQANMKPRRALASQADNGKAVL